MKECSFQPQVTDYKLIPRNPGKNGGVRSQTPIHERIGTLQREKNENLQRLRVKNEISQKDLTFQPKVNEKSKKIVQFKQHDQSLQKNNSQAYISANNIPGLSVQERLYKDATDRLERNFFKTMHEDVNLTPRGNSMKNPKQFQPNISQSSKWISENSHMFNGNLKDFHERQNAFLQKQ